MRQLSEEKRWVLVNSWRREGFSGSGEADGPLLRRRSPTLALLKHLLEILKSLKSHAPLDHFGIAGPVEFWMLSLED